MSVFMFNTQTQEDRFLINPITTPSKYYLGGIFNLLSSDTTINHNVLGLVRKFSMECGAHSGSVRLQRLEGQHVLSCVLLYRFQYHDAMQSTLNQCYAIVLYSARQKCYGKYLFNPKGLQGSFAFKIPSKEQVRDLQGRPGGGG